MDYLSLFVCCVCCVCVVSVSELLVTGVANDKEKGRGVEGPEAAVIF